MNFSASSNQFCSVVYVSIMYQLFKHQNNDCWIQDQDLTHVNLYILGLIQILLIQSPFFVHYHNGSEMYKTERLFWRNSFGTLASPVILKFWNMALTSVELTSSVFGKYCIWQIPQSDKNSGRPCWKKTQKNAMSQDTYLYGISKEMQAKVLKYKTTWRKLGIGGLFMLQQFILWC